MIAMMDKRVILIVDDAEMNRKMLNEVLGKTYSIINASNGKEALEILDERSDEVDLVLLDLVMPEMDGLTLLSLIKERNYGKEIPIIILSSDQEPEDIECGFDLGIVDYYTYPCNTRILQNRIKNFFELQKVRYEELCAIKSMAAVGAEKAVSMVVDIENDRVVQVFNEKNNILGYEILDSYSDLYAKIVNGCPTISAQERCRKILSPDSLKSMCNEKKNFAEMQFGYIPGNAERILLKVVVNVNEKTGKGRRYVELAFSDFTEKYVQELLPKLLYENEYKFIGIIDLAQSTIMMKKITFNKDSKVFRENKVTDYNIVNQEMLHKHVAPFERTKFVQAVSIRNIENQVMQRGSYDFTITILDSDRNQHLIKFRYTIFDRSLNIVLITGEDVTDISEQDMLTDGLNRRGFIRNAMRILRDSSSDEKFDIYYFDIKSFKAVNELFGIKGGDSAIKYVMGCIRNSELEPLITARSSSDHFIALIRRDKSTAENIRSVCSERFERDGKTVTIYQRCGIYRIDDYSVGVSTMIDRAKLAVSYVTNEYAKPYEFYDDTMVEKYVDKNEVLGLLSDALKNEEFVPYYQPIYNTKTRKIVSAEALVRWKHPTRGILTPGLFIPGLEENGHVSQLDMYILRKAREDIEKRAIEGKRIVPVSVNLSRMDFYDEEMMENIIEDMKNVGTMKELCRFEITESSYVSIAETNKNTLSAIKELGAKLLIDDFGTGYSSINTITEYDFDIIKLDIGFVRKIGQNRKTESIICSLIDMAHNMGAEVIAEGTETEEQVNFLTEHGCDYLQGYYFSRPVSFEEFSRMLDAEA